MSQRPTDWPWQPPPCSDVSHCMRAALVIVMLAGAAGSAVACFTPDFDDVASGGYTVAQIGEGPRRALFTARVWRLVNARGSQRSLA